MSVPVKTFIRSLSRTVQKAFPLLTEIRQEHLVQKRIARNKAMSPRQLVESMYEKYLGFPPDLETPRRYTEKMQWRKLFDRNPLFSELSDKYAVRQWVASKIGDRYLIPLLGRWQSWDEIDFSLLPHEFVLKTNNASGTVVLVPDKSKMNHRLLRRKFGWWMEMDYTFVHGYESQYENIVPCILAEELLHDDCGGKDLRDYKFLCFGGNVEYVWVDLDRYHEHIRAVFNPDWQLQPWNAFFPVQKDLVLERPAMLDEMLSVARTLCEGFDHVRVDLYCTGNKVYFGEMTFTNGSGFRPITPDSWDYRLGDLWVLPKPIPPSTPNNL